MKELIVGKKYVFERGDTEIFYLCLAQYEMSGQNYVWMAAEGKQPRTYMASSFVEYVKPPEPIRPSDLWERSTESESYFHLKIIFQHGGYVFYVSSDDIHGVISVEALRQNYRKAQK